ncbi:hypothetical protein [Vibrio caribbeanicus]|uniref:hypothetical protein n=1 Tax=Vibrio caribbeanicus TaxID=701175 RepID=UPI0030D88905
MSSEQVKSLSFRSLVEQSNNQIAEIKKEQGAQITETARNIAFIAFCILGVFLIGFIAMQVIVGTIAMFVGVGGMVIMFYALRYLKMNDVHIKQKMRNRVIENMINEAKEHKIATLTNMVIDSKQRLENAREARDKMGGYVQKVKARVEQSDRSSSNYSRMAEMSQGVEDAYHVVRRSVEKAAVAHKSLASKVAEYKDMAEFSDMVNDAMTYAKSNTDSLEEMLGMEAFAAIEQDFHEAMVMIENSVSDYEIDNR